MSPGSVLAAYVVALLLGCATIGVYYHVRRKRFEPRPSEDHIFRCDECGSVYTDDPDVDRSRCPHCGRMNETFKF